MKVRSLKIILSLFLTYHLLAVVILPMGNGFMNRELGHYFIPYANQLTFNTTWQFFSPGPSPTFYLEYTFVSDSDPNLELETHLLPEKREGLGWSDFYSRRLYSMRFLALDAGRMRKYLAPWLCGLEPKARAVTVRQVYERVNSMESERAGTVNENFHEMSERVDLPQTTFECERSGGDV